MPLIPGQPVTLRFSLTPHPVILPPGGHLRLDLASRTDLLRDNVSHGYEQFDMQVPPYYSCNTIHFGTDSYSSRVDTEVSGEVGAASGSTNDRYLAGSSQRSSAPATWIGCQRCRLLDA